MKLGLESKGKTWALLGLLALFGYLAYVNFFAGPSASPAAPSAKAVAADPGTIPLLPEPAGSAKREGASAASGRNDREFHPVLHSKRPEEQIDPMTVDPTLHLELLAKLQEVSAEGGGRNLFQFGPPPPPPAAKAAAPPPMPAVQTPPPPPPPPPIPLKYYAFSAKPSNGAKTAFFLDGDQILFGGEGDILKKRYRVVRFGVNSVVVEDMQFNREQSLPLEENASLPG